MTENDRVREIRKAKSLTLEKFGERIGVTRSAISNIESGNRNMSDQMCRSICREFNVNETWLRTGEGEMFVEVGRDEAIDSFISDIKVKPDFRKRLVSVLARLSPDEWTLLESMALKLADDAPPSLEDEVRAEAEEYYAERLQEERAKARQSAFLEPSGSIAKMA